MRSGWCSAVDFTGVTLKRATVGISDTLPTRSDGGRVVASGSMEAWQPNAGGSARRPMATPSGLHEDLAELAFLLGDWCGTGEGVWPPGERFDYAEDVTFEFVGDPFLLYAQRSWSLDDGSPIISNAGSFDPRARGASSWCSPTRSDHRGRGRNGRRRRDRILSTAVGLSRPRAPSPSSAGASRSEATRSRSTCGWRWRVSSSLDRRFDALPRLRPEARDAA